jgi:hypothetical protein
MMTLDIKSTVPVTDVGELPGCIFGDYYVGKTTFVHDLFSSTGERSGEGDADGLLYCHTEPVKGLAFKHAFALNSWADVITLATELIKGEEAKRLREAGVRGIAIDCVDTLYKYAVDAKCTELKIRYPSENRAGWRIIADEFLTWLGRLSMCGLGFWAVCHEGERTISQSREGRVTKVAPNLPFTALSVINTLSALMLWATVARKEIRDDSGAVVYQAGQRVLFVDARDDAASGCRIQTWRLPEEVRQGGMELDGRKFREVMKPIFEV